MLSLVLIAALSQTPECPKVGSLQPSTNQVRSERLPESFLPLPEVLAARPCAAVFSVIRNDRPTHAERIDYLWDGERLAAWRTPEGTTPVSYDACGRVTRVGDLAAFRYDSRGLPVSDVAGFTFDTQGRLVKERASVGYSVWAYAQGKISRLSSSGSRSEALFDAEGRLTEERIIDDHGALALRLLWRHEPGRRVMEERAGDGTLHATTFWKQDRAGRPVDVLTLDPRGEPTQSTHYLYACPETSPRHAER
jgi:hypothetical protein